MDIQNVDESYITSQNFSFTKQTRSKYLWESTKVGSGFFVPETLLPNSVDLDKSPYLSPPEKLRKSGQIWGFKKHTMNGALGLLCVLREIKTSEVS